MLLSVNRLPPEIISSIARCVLDTRSIISLTHVCRYWRDSIISSPDNWTLIFSERRHLAALSLERAKAAPLTIHLNVDKLNRDPGFLDLLLPHAQNIIFLSVTSFLTIEELTKTLPSLLESIPNLQSLTLAKSRRADWAQVIDPFDFSAHTLRDLSLHNIPLYHSFLSLRSLSKLRLVDYHFNLHLDTLLNFLEENHSLESVDLMIGFVEPPLRRSQRRNPIGNRLQHLSISCNNTMDGRALISSITLRRGGALEVYCDSGDLGLTDILSGVSLSHLPNLSSPTFMEYRSYQRRIRLLGQDGSFLFDDYSNSENPFQEFPLLPLDSIREFRLEHRALSIPTKLHLSSFPSLEVLAIDGGTYNSPLSIVFPGPTSPSSLKTLALLDFGVTEDFIAELTQFASNRKSTASASLNRVVILNSSNGRLPSAASVERLRKRAPVVEVMQGKKLPKDLS